MRAILYKLAKRRNSTLKPDTELNEYVETEVVLKDATSILHPDISVASDLSAYNYLHLPDLNRYYFIIEWTYDRGRWIASCDVDVLASYYTAVYTYSGYVLRSASAPSGLIPDELAPRYQDVALSTVSIASPWIANLNAGVFVVGIINNDAGAYGAVSYYVLTAPQIQALKNQMMNTAIIQPDSTFEDVVGISKDLFQAMWNPIKYITSCMFFPIAGFGGGTEKPSLPLGWWTSSVTGIQILPTPYGNKVENIQIPKHPQSADSKYTYLKGSNYSRYVLHFPPFQDIILDADLLFNVTSIDIQLLIDPATGAGSLKITPHESNYVIAYTEAQIGVPMALAEISTDISNIKSGGIGLLGQAAGALAKSSALSFLGDLQKTGEQLLSGIGEIATAGSAKMLSTGSNGSLAAYFNCYPQLQAIFTRVKPVDGSLIGYPTCETKVLAQLTGYAMLYRPSINIPPPGTVTEAEMINTLLASGIYCDW